LGYSGIDRGVEVLFGLTRSDGDDGQVVPVFGRMGFHEAAAHSPADEVSVSRVFIPRDVTVGCGEGVGHWNDEMGGIVLVRLFELCLGVPDRLALFVAEVGMTMTVGVVADLMTLDHTSPPRRVEIWLQIP
jgi:hypothetical protein